MIEARCEVSGAGGRYDLWDDDVDIAGEQRRQALLKLLHDNGVPAPGPVDEQVDVTP